MQLLSMMLAVILLSLPLPALAYDVLVLQSLHEKGYNEAVRGMKRECSASMRTVVLSDYADADVVRIVREERPKLVVAVGEKALQAAQKVRNVPLLYMMVLNPKHRSHGYQTGVSMFIDPSRYLSVFQSADVRRVGVVYDPAKTGAYIKRAQAAARRAGIELVPREVHFPRETPSMLDSLRGRVDALWMIPDMTAVAPETTEAFFLFSQGERVPVGTFAEVYLSMGGAFSLGIDRFDIGRQVGEMVTSVLDGKPVEEIPVQFPRRASFKSNDGVLRRLKINLSGVGGS